MVGSFQTFANQAEAERALFSFRDDRLSLLSRLAHASDVFRLNYAPESLKTLERWYFDLLESDGFASLGTERATFEECMAMYFLETAVRNSDVEWTVDEYVFEQGRYEIGVKRPLFAQYAMRIAHLPLLKENKRRQALYREYNNNFSRKATL